MSLSKDLRKQVVGQKITKVLLNRFRNEKGCWPPFAYRPEIHLEDGTVIRFHVQETDVGEYGVEPVIYPRGHANGR